MVNLLGVSMASLPVGSDHLIALKIKISGEFLTGAELNSFFRDLIQSGDLDGAVISCGIAWNVYFAPSSIKDHHARISTEYPAGTDHFGSNSGTNFYRRNVVIASSDPESPIDYTVRIVTTNSSGTNAGQIYYTDKSLAIMYTGGFVGQDSYLSLMPLIIFEDENGKLLEMSGLSGYYCLFALSQSNWDGVSPSDGIFPVMTISSRNQSYYSVVPDNASVSGMLVTTNIPIGNVIDNEVPINADDPYAPGGYAGPDDSGSGDYNYSGDPQPFGDVPSWLPDGLDTGFFTLYSPTVSELQSLASYLWSANFDLNLFKRLFNNPMDLFLNLGVVPVSVPSGGSKEVGIGLISTGVYMTKAGKRYINKNMGNIYIEPTIKNYLDYAPYVQADLMLPYIGMVPIEVDAIMGMNLNVQYNIDLLSGTCVAGINKNKPGENGWHCIGTYAGNAMQSLPLTGADYSTIFSGLIQTAGAIAAGAASGGGAGAITGGLAAASSAVVSEGKPMIQKGGALSSAAGFLITQQKPVLIVSLPRQALPSLQISELGFPAFISDKWVGGIQAKKKLKEWSGFVRVGSIHLHDIAMTDAELTELETILKGGIYL